MKQFAYVDNGTEVRAVPTAEAAAANGSARLVWIHLDQNDAGTRPFLSAQSHLNDVVVNALTALETRPRCDAIGDGALINLRGLSLPASR